MANLEGLTRRETTKRNAVAGSLGVHTADLPEEMWRLRREGGPEGSRMSNKAIAARITAGVDGRPGEYTTESWVCEFFRPRKRSKTPANATAKKSSSKASEEPREETAA